MTAADASAHFAALLAAAAAEHASQLVLRLEGDRLRAVAVVTGSEAVLAEWPAAHAETLLPAAFSLCDPAEEAYAYGSARSLPMTGRAAPLPATIRSILMQFLPPRDNGRLLVARLTRDADMCCGTCGG